MNRSLLFELKADCEKKIFSVLDDCGCHGNLFVGALVIFAIIGVQIFHDMQRMHQLNELRVEANAEMKEVNADVDQLHQDVSLLKDDEYVAKLARSKFFYSKDGEKVYPILESNTDSSTNETDQSTSSTTAK